MLEFLRRNQVLFASGLFLTLSFFLLSANRDGVRRFDPLGAIFLEVLEPMQAVTTTGVGRVDDVWSGYVGLVGVAHENKALRERLAELEEERQRMLEIELENARLAKLLDVRSSVPAKALAARVVGKDASGWFETFTLDRGENDGVAAGMAVVSPEGVVGRIASASSHAARVLLISDHNSGVDALIQRTRARGIVEGTLAGAATLKYVKPAEVLEVGDVVVTSGLDGIFPKGLRLGRIVGVTKRESGLFQIADVDPFVEFSKLEEVLILLSPPRDVNTVLEGEEARRLTEKAARALALPAIAEATPLVTAPAAAAPAPGVAAPVPAAKPAAPAKNVAKPTTPAPARGAGAR